MGIPSYFSYIVKNHANLIRKLEKNTIPINNLYLDCNSIIYDAVKTIDFAVISDDMTSIIFAVCNKIDEYIKTICPDTNVFIAFDGVAPVAKLDQQRERRYKSLYQQRMSKDIFKDGKPDPWNTAAITPGTKFMSNLNDVIRRKYSDPKIYGVKNIILSPSDKYGEGEHKIFEYIRAYPDYHKDSTTIIYGLDADLIMLSINHLPISKQIYLYRETPEFIKSINSELEPNESYILDIPELANVITTDMNNANEENKDINRIYDYIFMCFFLGNDFMPHFPSINIRTGGVDKMLNAYKATIGNTPNVLTDGNKIYWKQVRELVGFLSKVEEQNLKNETKLRDRKEKLDMPSVTPEDQYRKFDAIPGYSRVLEKYINPYKLDWESRYYKALFEVRIDEVRKKQICVNYLEGLEWTMKYYTTGCPDWRWSYNYAYPPLLCDLMHYIPIYDTEFVPNKPPSPVSELVQLSYVLPKQSLHLLPAKLYNGLMREKPRWYESNCEFIWAYCKYFWESHVLLPHIDITELEEYVTKVMK